MVVLRPPTAFAKEEKGRKRIYLSQKVSTKYSKSGQISQAHSRWYPGTGGGNHPEPPLSAIPKIKSFFFPQGKSCPAPPPAPPQSSPTVTPNRISAVSRRTPERQESSREGKSIAKQTCSGMRICLTGRRRAREPISVSQPPGASTAKTVNSIASQTIRPPEVGPGHVTRPPRGPRKLRNYARTSEHAALFFPYTRLLSGGRLRNGWGNRNVARATAKGRGFPSHCAAGSARLRTSVAGRSSSDFRSQKLVGLGPGTRA